MRFGANAMRPDRKSTRLNSSHTVIYTLSLHDALPICIGIVFHDDLDLEATPHRFGHIGLPVDEVRRECDAPRSEEHTSELQSHSDLHSFPTRRSSDLHWHRFPR